MVPLVVLAYIVGFVLLLFFLHRGLHIIHDIVTFRCWQVHHWRTDNVSLHLLLNNRVNLIEGILGIANIPVK